MPISGDYTSSDGVFTFPTGTPYDTIEVKKSGYKQVETKVSESDIHELVVVMKKI